MHVASMMGGVGTDPEATVRRVPVRTSLPFPAELGRAIPSRYRTPFYRSSIPDTVARGGYDLVHIHNPTPALEMERVAAACARAGVPYVISTHGYNEVAHGHRVHGGGLMPLAWRRLAYSPVARATRGAAAVFALSPADIPILHAMGVREGAVRVVPNGVPMPAPADQAAIRAVRDRFGLGKDLPDRPLTCMFLGNHTPNKGLPVLLEAFRAIERPFRLVIGGDRRQGIDYEGAVRAARPGQQVVVTGRLSDGEVSALMYLSDLFVFPTLADTFPLVVLEAMAHGLPVLATAVGGIPYMLGDDCGALVAPGDPGAIAAAVERLATRPRRLSEMGDGARARAKREFTWDRAASLAFAGYEAVLGRAPALAAE